MARGASVGRTLAQPCLMQVNGVIDEETCPIPGQDECFRLPLEQDKEFCGKKKTTSQAKMFTIAAGAGLLFKPAESFVPEGGEA